MLESIDSGESNRLISIFTRDLGLVRASAQGIRDLKSKLRYSVQDLSFGTVALVKGREVWRLTSANKLISLYDPRLPVAVRRLFSRVFAFITRLVSGEGKNPELYGILSDLSAFCFSAERAQAIEYIDEIEILARLRVLESLGYGPAEEKLAHFIHQKEWNKEIFDQIRNEKTLCIREIDKALRETHL